MRLPRSAASLRCRRATAIAVLAVASPVAAQTLATPPRVPEARIDSLVRARMADRRIPGVAVAVVYDGRTLFEPLGASPTSRPKHR